MVVIRMASACEGSAKDDGGDKLWNGGGDGGGGGVVGGMLVVIAEGSTVAVEVEWGWWQRGRLVPVGGVVAVMGALMAEMVEVVVTMVGSVMMVGELRVLMAVTVGAHVGNGW